MEQFNHEYLRCFIAYSPMLFRIHLLSQTVWERGTNSVMIKMVHEARKVGNQWSVARRAWLLWPYLRRRFAGTLIINIAALSARVWLAYMTAAEYSQCKVFTLQPVRCCIRLTEMRRERWRHCAWLHLTTNSCWCCCWAASFNVYTTTTSQCQSHNDGPTVL